MKKYYGGIGSRHTPTEIMMEMVYIADRLQYDYTLRSGAAQGADSAFEMGCTNGNKEIYLPWKGFMRNSSTLYNTPKLAYDVAERFHSHWNQLSDAAKKLMARNTLQVLGHSLEDKASFIICWTPDGCESQKTRNIKTGGTGQAISIAEYFDIPVINMKNWNWKDRLNEITDIQLY